MTRTDPPAPTLRLKLDRDALGANWRALDAMSGDARAGAAVKADCYGIGVDNALPALRNAGARSFYVAHWSEAAAVLRHVAPDQVTVLHGVLNRTEADYARAIGVRPAINSLLQAQTWLDSGGGPCDLMVDTGINRLGLSMHEIGDPLVARLEVVTVMSHLASADEESPDNPRQLARAHEVFTAIPARYRSLANSAGIALGSDYAFDITRPGLALYGGVPRDELAGSIRQVAFPQAAVIQRRQLAPGDAVGYNGTYVAQQTMPVGVVSLGYADGYLRCWAGKGVLQHGETRLAVLGRISMDMVVIDLRAAPELREGDWLDIPWNLRESAEISGLSQYELLTGFGRRLRG